MNHWTEVETVHLNFQLITPKKICEDFYCLTYILKVFPYFFIRHKITTSRISGGTRATCPLQSFKSQFWSPDVTLLYTDRRRGLGPSGTPQIKLKPEFLILDCPQAPDWSSVFCCVICCYRYHYWEAHFTNIFSACHYPICTGKTTITITIDSFLHVQADVHPGPPKKCDIVLKSHIFINKSLQNANTNL